MVASTSKYAHSATAIVLVK